MSTPAGDDPDDNRPPGQDHTPSRHDGATSAPALPDNDVDAAPAEKPNRRKWLLLGGAIVAVVISISAGVWYFTSEPTADSPSDVTELYLEAIKDRDTDQAGKLLCNAITKGKGVKVSDEYNVTKLNYSVGTPRQISKTQFHVPVTVEAEFSSNGKKTMRKDTPTYQVIKEDGGWKMCGFAPTKSVSESEANGTNSR